jgi:apolipoprotein N-acyltransferase
MALALPGLLLNGNTRGTALCTAAIAIFVLNVDAKPLSQPRGWGAENTSVHRKGVANHLAEFSIEQNLQSLVASSTKMFIVFPEGAVRLWTDATQAAWTDFLAGTGKTLLLGAARPIAGSPTYNNSVVIVGREPHPPTDQRIPVPGGMWNSLRRKGAFALNLFGAGTVEVGGERAAILICYEQLLTWPVLRSAVESPTLLIAMSNEVWTANTVVPRVQHACARAWARLFGLPLISAINS